MHECSRDKNLSLKGYDDADYANDKHDKEVCQWIPVFFWGHAIDLESDETNHHRSIFHEAEDVALSEACKEIVCLRAFLKELAFPQKSATQYKYPNRQ